MKFTYILLIKLVEIKLLITFSVAENVGEKDTFLYDWQFVCITVFPFGEKFSNIKNFKPTFYDLEILPVRIYLSGILS